MEIGSSDCPAGNGYPMASMRVQAVLDFKVAGREAWAANNRTRASQADSANV